MNFKELSGTLEHEFLLHACKHGVESCTDIEEMRKVCMALVQLVETQKKVYGMMLQDALEFARQQSTQS